MIRLHQTIHRQSFIGRVPLLVALLSSLLLVQCGSTKNIDWIYVIPDQYQGFVAIYYHCPGGTPLVYHGASIEVRFGPTGVFCTSDAFVPTAGEVVAKSMSGRMIPYFNPGTQQQGYAVNYNSCGMSGIESQGKRWEFKCFLVGDSQYLEAMQNPNVYGPQYRAFLLDRFGIVYPSAP